MGRIASTRTGAKVFRVVLPFMDRVMMRLTKGRRLFTNHAVPTLILTTTGRKSGEPRRQPLCYIEDAGDFVVVGSNWGQEHHPAWTANLLADSHGTVTVEAIESPVTARLVSEEEWAALYPRFESMSANYRSYKGWASDRKIRMFRLTRSRS